MLYIFDIIFNCIFYCVHSLIGAFVDPYTLLATCEIIFIVSHFLSVLVCLLLTVAFFTVFERKLLGSIQQRLGPNKVGILGLLQAIADAVKLFAKEITIPIRAGRFLFVWSALSSFFFSMYPWIIIPISQNIVVCNIALGILVFLLISSLNAYSIIISGWSSNSRYSFIGALRSTAQMISYELTMSTIILNVTLLAGSLNLIAIIGSQAELWYIVPLMPQFIIFFICCLAETNRSPFDLPEAESELVSGYNTEHSAFPFALFFLGEYIGILFLCHLMVILFFGGWCVPWFLQPYIAPVNLYGIKVFIMLFVFVWVRASLPRFRYDQLMRLGWKVFLPLSFFLLTTSVALLFLFDGFPPSLL